MSSPRDESVPSSHSSQSAQSFQNEQGSSTEGEEFSSPNLVPRLDPTDGITHDSTSPTTSAGQVDEQLSYLSEEESDQSESHLASRFNKYDGPQSTRRKGTALERALAESLDQLTAKDLAVHLYNVHALKRRARKVSVQRRSRSADNGDPSTNGQEWMPTKNWTAWPLPPDLVPRNFNGPHWSYQDFLQPSHSDDKHKTSRQELKDLLVAQVIKKAKQRNSCFRQKDGERLPETESETLLMKHIDNSSNFSDPESLDELEPVILLDDDVSNDLLQPMVHHILTKFDGLLGGLHHAWYTYMAIDSSDEHGSVSRRSKKQRSRPLAGLGEIGAESSLQALKSGPGTSTDSDNESTAKSSRISQKSHSSLGKRGDRMLGWRRANLGLRDWSDVIGVASMTGWDSKIVQKAAFRCSTLFEEGIKFRRLEENGNDSKEFSVLPNTSWSDSSSAGEETPQANSVPAWKFHCPFSKCNRFSRGFSNSIAAKRHMKQVHKDAKEFSVLPNTSWSESSSGGDEMPQETQCSYSVPARATDSQEKRDEECWKFHCPLSTCNRYRIGFSNSSAMKRHMKKVHKNAALGKLGVKESGVKESEVMVGGVHLDGFLQPIPRVDFWIAQKEITTSQEGFSDQSER
ncbi:hypothetical protein MMC07_002355 [Pseudocyphellaria aurata]|nr:hypothetical protein [Pseudocyphellaria aurata]